MSGSVRGLTRRPSYAEHRRLTSGRARRPRRLPLMSGHSKWASIKHKKAVVDSRRGAQFSKLARAIMVAARDGGGDRSANPTLENAVRKAKEASMPKDNIERAIAKGTGEGGEAETIETVLYEGYGHAVKLMRLLESLEELDDVEAVHANFDAPAEVLERVAG